MIREKLNKNFKISYILNCIVFVITLFWIISIFKYDSRNIFEDLAIGFVYIVMFLIHFIISLITLIITIILGINNYKNTEQRNTKKNITMMISILGIVHIIILMFTIVTILLA